MSEEFDALSARIDNLQTRLLAMEAALRSLQAANHGAQPPSHHISVHKQQTLQRIASPTATETSNRLPEAVVEAARRDSPPAPPSPAHTPEPRTALQLEQLIGARTFGVAGGVIVVLAVGLFLKLAWDKGWLAGIPDAVKCAVCWGVGLSLVALAEVLRKRINIIAAAGLYIAGLGAVYVTSWAAYGFFAIVPRESSFVLLALTALFGVGIAWRARLVAIGVASLACGYLAPLILQTGVLPHPAVLPSYWLTLLAVALAASVRHVRGVIILRAAAIWATMAFGAWWLGRQGVDAPLLAFAFLSVTWFGVHAELARAARRESVKRDPDDESPSHSDRVLTPEDAHTALVTFALTSWTAGYGYWIIEQNWPGFGWWACAGAFAGTAMAALALAGGLRVLRDDPDSPAERLGACLAVQAGALLLVTIALTLAPWMESVAWLALGSACVVAGAWNRLRSIQTYGFVTLVLASFRVLSLSWWVAPGGVDLAGLHLTQWSIMPMLAAAAWTICALLLLRDRDSDSVGAIACAAISALFLFISIGHRDTEPNSLAVAWLAISASIAACRTAVPRLRLEYVAFLGLVATFFAWVVAYHTADGILTSGQFGAHGESDPTIEYLPLLHPSLPLGAAIAVTGLWQGASLARRKKGGEEEAIGQFASLVSLGVLLLATSIEAARSAVILTDDETSRRAVVSIWWALFALGLLVLGFVRRKPPIRYLGLALLGVAGAKTVVFDLAFVDPGWRIVSLLGVGALMLLVAIGYARIAKSLEDANQASATPETDLAPDDN